MSLGHPCCGSFLTTAHEPDCRHWTPTAANINALPDPLRRYIHHLETNADPAGMVRDNIRLQRENDELRAECGRLSKGGVRHGEHEVSKHALGLLEITRRRNPDGSFVHADHAAAFLFEAAYYMGRAGGALEWGMIERLREEEASTVTIVSDNADFNGQPNSKVICSGGWTLWNDRTFTGDNVTEALKAAVDAMQKVLA